VRQAVLDAMNADQKFHANGKTVESLREASVYNRQRFELGLINTYEYSISRNNLLRGEANLLQAKYDYLFRLKLLDFYQGKPLTF
jgi:outer membrane protein